MKNVLVPYDSSNYSKIAFDKALEIASKLGSTLHVLTVIGPDVNVSGMSYSRAQDALDEYEKEAKKEFEKLEKKVAKKKEKIALKTHIIHDQSATSGVIRFVEGNKVDLIVIGSHGRTGLRKVVLGSVATGVIKDADCPVMVVKEPKKKIE